MTVITLNLLVFCSVMLVPCYCNGQECFEILNGDVYLMGVFPFNHKNTHVNGDGNARQMFFFYASFIKRHVLKSNSIHANGTTDFRTGYVLYHGNCAKNNKSQLSLMMNDLLDGQYGVNKSSILVLFGVNESALEEVLVAGNLIDQNIPVFLLKDEEQKRRTSYNNITTRQYHLLRPQISIEAYLFHELLKMLNWKRFRMVSVDDFYETFIEHRFLQKLTRDRSLCFQYTKLKLNATTRMIDLKLKHEKILNNDSEVIFLFGRQNAMEIFINHLKSSNISGKVFFIHSLWSHILKDIEFDSKSNVIIRAKFLENPYIDLKDIYNNNNKFTALDSVFQAIYNVSDEETRLMDIDPLNFERLLSLANILNFILRSSIDEVRIDLAQNNREIPSQLTVAIYNSTLDKFENIIVYNGNNNTELYRIIREFLPEKVQTSCETSEKVCKFKHKPVYEAIQLTERTQLFQNICVKCSSADNHTTIQPYFSAAAYAIYSLMSIGVLTSMTIGLIFYFFRNTPYVKASHQLMSLIQLFAHFLLFITPMMFVAKPTEELCTARPILFGILFTFIMAMTLTKTQKLVYIFRSRIRVSRRHVQMSQAIEISLILLMMFIQACIAGLSYLMSPSRIVILYNHETSTYITKCNTEEEFIIQLIFGFLLAVMSMIQAFKARKLPENFNETKLIFVTMILCVISVIICIPLRIYLLSNTDKAVIDIVLLLLLNFILLVTMYGHKCWIIIFHPDQNTTSAFKQNLQIHHLRGLVPSHVNMDHRDSTYSTTLAIELMTTVPRYSVDNTAFRSSQLSVRH